MTPHRTPDVHSSASVGPSAVLAGDVTVGAGSRVLEGAVLHGDLGPVRIGEDVVVMEHSVLRGRADHPVGPGLPRDGLATRGTPMREVMRRMSETFRPR